LFGPLETGVSRPGARARGAALLVNNGHRSTSPPCLKSANFNREPAFLLRRLSYMRDLPPERADGPRERIGVDGGGRWFFSKIAI